MSNDFEASNCELFPHVSLQDDVFFCTTRLWFLRKNTCLLKDDDSHPAISGTQMTLLLVGKGSGFEGLTMSFGF